MTERFQLNCHAYINSLTIWICGVCVCVCVCRTNAPGLCRSISISIAFHVFNIGWMFLFRFFFLFCKKIHDFISNRFYHLLSLRACRRSDSRFVIAVCSNFASIFSSFHFRKKREEQKHIYCHALFIEFVITFLCQKMHFQCTILSEFWIIHA